MERENICATEYSILLESPFFPPWPIDWMQLPSNSQQVFCRNVYAYSNIYMKNNR